MNLYKIYKKLSEYVHYVKGIKIPDVYDLYVVLGSDAIGRNVYKESDKICFNKSIIHKGEKCYIGQWREGFYAQDIVKIKKEERCLCVNGTANKYQEIADKVIKDFGLQNFVFDVWNEKYIMEVNELHLSSITKDELNFILSMIL